MVRCCCNRGIIRKFITSELNQALKSSYSAFCCDNLEKHGTSNNYDITGDIFHCDFCQNDFCLNCFNEFKSEMFKD